jgi:hypothetical protein
MTVFVPTGVAEEKDVDDLHLLGVGQTFEWRVSPSEVKRVRDAGALEGCANLGSIGKQDMAEAARRGGDTLFVGKDQSGYEGVWLYRCKAGKP